MTNEPTITEIQSAQDALRRIITLISWTELPDEDRDYQKNLLHSIKVISGLDARRIAADPAYCNSVKGSAAEAIIWLGTQISAIPDIADIQRKTDKAFKSYGNIASAHSIHRSLRVFKAALHITNDNVLNLLAIQRRQEQKVAALEAERESANQVRRLVAERAAAERAAAEQAAKEAAEKEAIEAAKKAAAERAAQQAALKAAAKREAAERAAAKRAARAMADREAREAARQVVRLAREAAKRALREANEQRENTVSAEAITSPPNLLNPLSADRASNAHSEVMNAGALTLGLEQTVQAASRIFPAASAEGRMAQALISSIGLIKDFKPERLRDSDYTNHVLAAIALLSLFRQERDEIYRATGGRGEYERLQIKIAQQRDKTTIGRLMEDKLGGADLQALLEGIAAMALSAERAVVASESLEARMDAVLHKWALDDPPQMRR